MADIRTALKDLVSRILDGSGTASPQERQAAFNNRSLAAPLDQLIDKVARYAYRITDEDLDAVRSSGRTEDQIFELVICGAVGQAARQYEAGLAALAAATEKK